MIGSSNGVSLITSAKWRKQVPEGGTHPKLLQEPQASTGVGWLLYPSVLRHQMLKLSKRSPGSELEWNTHCESRACSEVRGPTSNGNWRVTQNPPWG